MKNFYIDGSSKGLTMGYGIVEVDEIGFMKLHEGYSIHPNSTSNMAELFALEETLKLISNMGTKTSYTIILDQYRILRLFDYTLDYDTVSYKTGLPVEDGAYVARIRELFSNIIANLYPYGTIELKKIVNDTTPEEVIYENTAHKLSRNYFGKVDTLFLEENTPLKEDTQGAKLKINRITKSKDIGFSISHNGNINIDVIRDTDGWYSQYQGLEVVKAKSVANVILITMDQISRELKEEKVNQVGFFSETNMYRSIQSSLSYENCPDDLREKAHMVMDLISEKKVRLVTKKD